MATNHHHLPRCRLARGGVGVVSAGGASKAQAALARILAVISTVRPSLTFAPLKSTAAFGNHHRDSQAPGFDLNLRLGVETQGDEKNGGDRDGSLVIDPFAAATAAGSVGLSIGSISPTESVAGDARTTERSSEGECDPKKQEEVGKRDDDEDGYSEEEEKEEISEISNNNNNNSNNIVVVVGRGEKRQSRENGSKREEGNYLDLLLEAVQHELLVPPEEKAAEIKTETMPTKEQASVGINDDDNNTPSKKRVGSSLKWTAAVDFFEAAEEEETAPLVRSKRGRNQTLPSRYRDSVLEPWAKPPTVNRHATARTRTRSRSRTTKT